MKELQQEWAPGSSHREGPDSYELKRRKPGFLVTAWWRLAWEASCDEVSCRFGDVENTCSAVSFSMPLLYRRIFWFEAREHDEFITAIGDGLSDFVHRKTGEGLWPKGRLRPHSAKPSMSMYGPEIRSKLWRHAVHAWTGGWFAGSGSTVAAGQREIQSLTSIPEADVQLLPDGTYEWRGYRAGPGDPDECCKILNNKWQETQHRTLLAKQK